MAVLTCTVVLIALPVWERSGVLKYSYPGTWTRSTYWPSALVSRSNTVNDASALLGNTMVSAILAHVYAALAAMMSLASQSDRENTVVPTHAHPAA